MNKRVNILFNDTDTIQKKNIKEQNCVDGMHTHTYTQMDGQPKNMPARISFIYFITYNAFSIFCSTQYLKYRELNKSANN